MSEINKQIEEMAEKMEKSSTDPKESLFTVIKSLGKEGLKQKLATLSDDEKTVLKAALEEMTLQKGGVGSGVKGHTTAAKEPVGNTFHQVSLLKQKMQNQLKAGKIEAAKNTLETIKKLKGSSVEKSQDLELSELEKAVSFDDVYQAKFVQGKVTDTVIQEDKADDDQDEKLVKPAAAKIDHQGTPTEGWSGQVIKSIEAQLDEVVEKAMEKCKDDKMVMKKLKEKGMDEGKVQGALDKYKMKKDGVKKSEGEDLEKGKAREEAKEKIMSMEEKEHGTKDPKKLVAAEKKEHMKKSDDEIEKAKMNKEEDQLGDAPDMKDGKQMAKKTAAPDIEDNAKANKKNMTKSTSWAEHNLLKANTGGRNFHFNVEEFITETLKNEPKEEVKKADDKDLNEIISKGGDRNWDQVNADARSEASKKKQNGKLVKSFSDEDLREAMGLSEEDYKKMIGE